jgi:prophage DNA circulation protein
MSYLTTSRYQQSQEESTVIGVLRTDTGRFVDYTTYTTTYGERMDQIAARLFGDPTRWWEIAEINPEVPFPAGIEAGTVLRVPTA